MPRLRIPRSFAAIAAAAVVACTTTPTNVCACLQIRPHNVVHGRVTDAAGAPLPNAVVRVEAGPAPCGVLRLESDAYVDAAGEYSAMVARKGPSGDVCVRLVVWDLAPGGVRFSQPQQFTMLVPVALPPDSVRRDIVLAGS
jgi:hypothetical protein